MAAARLILILSVFSLLLW